jgi:hypothetical protein
LTPARSPAFALQKILAADEEGKKIMQRGLPVSFQ